MINDDLQGGGFGRSSNDIEADIRQTRSRMDTTIDELGERLSARYIMNSALDWWETRTTSARSQGVAGAKVAGRVLGRQIKANPMPSLLIGAGIAWLLFKDNEPQERYTYSTVPGSTPPYGGMGGVDDGNEGPGFTDKVKDKMAGAKEAVTGAAGAVGDKMSSLTHAAGETASDLRESARERASAMSGSMHEAAHHLSDRARGAVYRGRDVARQLGHSVHEGYDTGIEQVRRGMDEYPLAAALGFAALGALVGLVLPHTRREDELMGERAEQLIGAAKEKGKDLIDRGKVVAERVAQTALSEAQKQGLTPESASSALSGLASKAGEVLQRTKEEAVSAAEEQGISPNKLREQVGAAQGGSSGQEQSSTGAPGGQSESGSGVERSATMPSTGSASLPTGPAPAVNQPTRISGM